MKKRDGVRDKLWEVVLCQTVPSIQVPGVESPEESLRNGGQSVGLSFGRVVWDSLK